MVSEALEAGLFKHHSKESPDWPENAPQLRTAGRGPKSRTWHPYILAGLRTVPGACNSGGALRPEIWSLGFEMW